MKHMSPKVSLTKAFQACPSFTFIFSTSSYDTPLSVIVTLNASVPPIEDESDSIYDDVAEMKTVMEIGGLESSGKFESQFKFVKTATVRIVLK